MPQLGDSKTCSYCSKPVIWVQDSGVPVSPDEPPKKLRWRPHELDGLHVHMCRGPKATPWKHDARKPPKPAEGRKRDPSKPKPPCPL